MHTRVGLVDMSPEVPALARCSSTADCCPGVIVLNCATCSGVHDAASSTATVARMKVNARFKLLRCSLDKAREHLMCRWPRSLHLRRDRDSLQQTDGDWKSSHKPMAEGREILLSIRSAPEVVASEIGMCVSRGEPIVDCVVRVLYSQMTVVTVPSASIAVLED